jgi:hypothetical protein
MRQVNGTQLAHLPTEDGRTNSHRHGITGKGEVRADGNRSTAVNGEVRADGNQRTVTQVADRISQDGTNSHRHGITGKGEGRCADGNQRTVTQVADRISQDGTILTQVAAGTDLDGNGCLGGSPGRRTGVVQSKSLLRSRGGVKLVKLGIGANLTGRPVPDSGTPRSGRNTAE